MKRHFKHEAESEMGTGTVYLEIVDDWPSRQVEIYGDTWRWADEAHDEWLADQPLDVLGLGSEHEIPEQDFEQVWREAQSRCPPAS
jgi:hypothetical protein